MHLLNVDKHKSEHSPTYSIIHHRMYIQPTLKFTHFSNLKFHNFSTLTYTQIISSIQPNLDNKIVDKCKILRKI